MKNASQNICALLRKFIGIVSRTTDMMPLAAQIFFIIRAVDYKRKENKGRSAPFVLSKELRNINLCRYMVLQANDYEHK